MLQDAQEWLLEKWASFTDVVPGDNDWMWLVGVALVLLYWSKGPKKRKR